MPGIDSGTQFIGISPDVNMQEKKSTLANSPTQVYTMDDITNTVLEYVPQGPAEVTIPIKSADILALGTTPFELLPAPGEGTYYIIDRIAIEYIFGTAGYILPTSPTLYLDGCFDAYIDRSLITATNDTVCTISGNLRNTLTIGSGSGSVKVITNKDILNSNLVIGTMNSDNPTTGDGGLNVKITYRIATFG
jgi:hypothetical protein